MNNTQGVQGILIAPIQELCWFRDAGSFQYKTTCLGTATTLSQALRQVPENR